MRRLTKVLLHPLTALCGALVWNYSRHKRDLSTICVVTRKYVPWPLFVAGWLALTAWLLPHWLRPIFRSLTPLGHDRPNL